MNKTDEYQAGALFVEVLLCKTQTEKWMALRKAPERIRKAVLKRLEESEIFFEN